MRQISRLFATFLNRHRITETVHAAHVCSIAREILQKTLGETAQEVRVRFVKNNTLHLESTSSVLSSDLHMRRYDIQKAINTALESDSIDSVQITTV